MMNYDNTTRFEFRLPSRAVQDPVTNTTNARVIDNCASSVHVPGKLEVSYRLNVVTKYHAMCTWVTVQRLSVYEDVNYSGPPPPICTDEYPAEYTFYNTSWFRKHLKNTMTRLTVSTTEPCPRFIGPEKRLMHIPLKVNLSINQPPSYPRDQPPLFSATVDWKIFAHTFLSHESLLRHPRSNEARSTSKIYEFVTKGESQQCTAILRDWIESQKGSGDVCKDRGLVLRQVFNLWIPTYQLPAPTFYSRFVARHYSLHIRLSLYESTRGHADIKLVIPLQITYVRVDMPCDTQDALVLTTDTRFDDPPLYQT